MNERLRQRVTQITNEWLEAPMEKSAALPPLFLGFQLLGQGFKGGMDLLGRVISEIPELVVPLAAVGLGLPIGAGYAGGHLSSYASEPGPLDKELLRKQELLTLLQRYTQRAEQQSRQLFGEED